MSARLSVRQFAKQAGCDEKQVRRAIEKGLISKGEDGLLDAAQADGGWRKPNRRGVDKLSAQPVRTTANVRTNVRTRGTRADNTLQVPVVRTDETAEEAAERIVAAGGLLSLKDAMELKENYLARHQQLSYDLKAKTVVLIEEVTRTVGAEYAGVRKKLLAIPAERAPAIHRLKTVAEVEALLRSVIVEALEGLTRDGPPPA